MIWLKRLSFAQCLSHVEANKVSDPTPAVSDALPFVNLFLIRLQRYVQFDFLEKGLGIVSPTYFVDGFSRKMFLLLYSVN